MIHWGILGCGRIAAKFASDLKLVDNAELIACGARSRESADAFAAQFSIKHKHYSYEDLVNDKDVDVIYIATPHSHHHQHTLLCLENNKAVLCEKAFAINYKQAKEMIDVARNKKIFLMEAVWTKFLEPFKKVQSMINEGMLGELKSMQLNFGFKPPENMPQRIYDPSLGGGTVLDIGIYNIFTTLYFLGKPDSIQATMTPASTGIDAQCAATFNYNNGAIAQLFSTFLSDTSTTADICGTEGRVHLSHRYYTPFTTISYFSGKPDTKQMIEFTQVEKGFGYEHEAKHVCDCLEKGMTESDVMTHEDSLMLMQVMDEVRMEAGIKYNVD